MALKIRLARGGAKKRPFIVLLLQKRLLRDGRYVEKTRPLQPNGCQNNDQRLL